MGSPTLPKLLRQLTQRKGDGESVFGDGETHQRNNDQDVGRRAAANSNAVDDQGVDHGDEDGNCRSHNEETVVPTRSAMATRSERIREQLYRRRRRMKKNRLQVSPSRPLCRRIGGGGDQKKDRSNAGGGNHRGGNTKRVESAKGADDNSPVAPMAGALPQESSTCGLSLLLQTFSSPVCPNWYRPHPTETTMRRAQLMSLRGIIAMVPKGRYDDNSILEGGEEESREDIETTTSLRDRRPRRGDDGNGKEDDRYVGKLGGEGLRNTKGDHAVLLDNKTSHTPELDYTAAPKKECLSENETDTASESSSAFSQDSSETSALILVAQAGSSPAGPPLCGAEHVRCNSYGHNQSTTSSVFGFDVSRGCCYVMDCFMPHERTPEPLYLMATLDEEEEEAATLETTPRTNPSPCTNDAASSIQTPDVCETNSDDGGVASEEQNGSEDEVKNSNTRNMNENNEDAEFKHLLQDVKSYLRLLERQQVGEDGEASDTKIMFAMSSPAPLSRSGTATTAVTTMTIASAPTVHWDSDGSNDSAECPMRQPEQPWDSAHKDNAEGQGQGQGQGQSQAQPSMGISSWSSWLPATVVPTEHQRQATRQLSSMSFCEKNSFSSYPVVSTAKSAPQHESSYGKPQSDEDDDDEEEGEESDSGIGLNAIVPIPEQPSLLPVLPATEEEEVRFVEPKEEQVERHVDSVDDFVVQTEAENKEPAIPSVAEKSHQQIVHDEACDSHSTPDDATSPWVEAANDKEVDDDDAYSGIIQCCIHQPQQRSIDVAQYIDMGQYTERCRLGDYSSRPITAKATISQEDECEHAAQSLEAFSMESDSDESAKNEPTSLSVDSEDEEDELRDDELQEDELQEDKLQEDEPQEDEPQEDEPQEDELQEAELQEAELQEAELQEAELQEAELKQVELQQVELQQDELQEDDELPEDELQEDELQKDELQEDELQQDDEVDSVYGYNAQSERIITTLTGLPEVDEDCDDGNKNDASIFDGSHATSGETSQISGNQEMRYAVENDPMISTGCPLELSAIVDDLLSFEKRRQAYNETSGGSVIAQSENSNCENTNFEESCLHTFGTGTSEHCADESDSLTPHDHLRNAPSSTQQLLTCRSVSRETMTPTEVRFKQKRRFADVSVLLLLMDVFMYIPFFTLGGLIWTKYLCLPNMEPQYPTLLRSDNRRATEFRYHRKDCTDSDVTTSLPMDLYLEENATADDAYWHNLQHGVTVIRQLLLPETASQLRSHVMALNSKSGKDERTEESNQYRTSLGLTVQHPTVALAMQEITTHSQFSIALRKILGSDPMLVKMNAITSSYGAHEDEYHNGVSFGMTPIMCERSFFRVLLPLQNTSSSLGATGVCPGSHFCGFESTRNLCERRGFQSVFNRDSDTPIWAAGDGMIMNSNSFHRACAHTDPDGSDQVMIALKFSTEPHDVSESSQYGQDGCPLSTRRDTWGHRWRDLQNAASILKFPWSVLEPYWIDLEGAKISITAVLRSSVVPIPVIPMIVAVVISALAYLLSRKPNQSPQSERLLVALRRRLVVLGVFSYCVWTRTRYNSKSASLHTDMRKNSSQDNIDAFDDEQFGTHRWTTLPTRNDVLIEHQHVSSRNLGIFKDLIEHGHPGNVRLQQFVHFFVKNHNGQRLTVPLTTQIIDRLANNICDTIRQESGRFLQQGGSGKWHITTRDAVLRHIRKTLVSQNYPPLGAIIQGAVNPMTAELLFGNCQHTALCQKHASSHLRSLERKLFVFEQIRTDLAEKQSLTSSLAYHSTQQMVVALDGSTLIPVEAAASSISAFNRKRFQATGRRRTEVPARTVIFSAFTPVSGHKQDHLRN